MLNIICGILLIAICVYMLVSVFNLHSKIQKQNMEIEADKQLMELSRISDEHVNEEQLQQANKKAELAIKKGTGINNFDSEVRPMLDFVIHGTKRIIESDIAEEERHELSLSISREVKKLSNLVENVLLMARIDSKRIRYSIVSVCVGDLIKSLYEEYEAQDGSQYSSKEDGGCKFDVIEGRPNLHIHADVMYLKKAIREVINNALTFSRKGDIFIGWFYQLGTNEVEIFVEDNGIGISPESQSHVFDVFYKENNTTGLGVGLSVAKDLVEKMGGRIALESRPNVGTRISILFPAIQI